MIKQTAAIIGRLCFDMFPETGSELKALESKIIKLQNEIDMKCNCDIDAYKDIELVEVLQRARIEYINSGKEFA